MSGEMFPCRTCGTMVGRQSVCAVCEKPVCHNCQGNPDALAGSYVACKNHVGKVNGMNKEHLRRLRRNYE